MTDEERRIITSFVERVSGAANAAPARPASPWGALGGGAQPAQPALPPVDPEADRLLGDLMARYPEARYRLTQMAFVQEAALVEMQNRIQQLEWEVENARRQGATQQNRGMLGGLFGGGGGRPAPMPPRPQPQYPPGYNPGMLQQRSGPGFLGTAMMTAAGVAGGLILGNAIMGALSGGGAEAATTAAGDFAQDAVPTSSPWTDPGAAAAPADDAAAYDQGYGADDAGAYDDGGGFDEEI
jgi:hypothetical protein